MLLQIEVRDGRVGRDPNKVDEKGYGELLMTFESDRPFDEGDLITLPTGEEVTVIGLTEHIGHDGWRQILSVGNKFLNA